MILILDLVVGAVRAVAAPPVVPGVAPVPPAPVPGAAPVAPPVPAPGPRPGPGSASSAETSASASASLVRSVVSSVLNTQLPAVVLTSIQRVNRVLSIIFAVETDESEAPALLGPVVLGYVDIPDTPVLLEQALEVVNGSPVAEAVHLEANHLGDIRRRPAPATSSVIISARHLGGF